MTEQKNSLIASRICFRSSSRSWLNHRQGRMVSYPLRHTHYAGSISLCNEMIGAENFNKLDHLQQLFLEEMCSRILRKLTALSIQYFLDHTVPRLNDSDVASLLRKSVTYVQYRAFMSAIFSYLLPHGLVGKCNMELAVGRISSTLFKLGFDESIRLNDLFSTPFKTSALKWLRHLSSYELCCIHRKFMLWLLEFSVHVTRQSRILCNTRKQNETVTFLPKRYMETHRKSQFPFKVKGVMKSTVGVRIRFLPKNSGTRSLIVPTRKSFLRQYSTIALKIASAVIDLICAKQRKYSKELPFTGAAVWNGISGFPKRFRRFIQMNGSARIYAVKTDVQECFNCINHNLLRTVLRKFILLTKHFRLNANVIGMSSLIFARQYGFRCRIDDHNCNLSELCVTGEMVMWFLETYVINKE
ncbi:unnamed protein product, partial [Onchocerca flexuosa]|uniref:Telomerase catalytic subunit n=1 Tax=Onchocerca flexuosa TaxID=387005 RepID=A0A183H738_9BILA